MAIVLLGADGLPINSNGNGALKSAIVDQAGRYLAVTPGQALPTPSGLLVAGRSDNTARVLRLDRMGNARVGFDTLLFHDDVEGATLNTWLWAQSLTTFTMAQVATTGINFNNGNGVASGSASILTSQKWYLKTQMSPLRVRYRMRVVPQTNAIAEFGFGNPSGITAQIPTGAFWRYTGTGSVVPVIAFNGSDTQQGTDISTLLTNTNYYTWGVIIDDDFAMFTCQDVLTGEMISEQILQIPRTQPRLLSTTHIPNFVRLYTSAACPSAPYVYLSDTCVVQLDINQTKDWKLQMAAMSQGAEVSPTAFTITANNANSAAPASATLSNTTAGYATLGGQYQFVAVAGAETDYALFGFAVPAPYSLYVTGIHISCFNMGAAVATTPTLLQWSVDNNAPAVTLASNSMRTTVGSHYLPVGAVIGQAASDIDIPFEVPLRTDSGRYFHVILKMPVGTATASQIIRGTVGIRGFFE